MINRGKLLIARGLRKNLTKSEAILWNKLRRRQLLDLNFRRQHVIDGFILDFYCCKLKLAIEIDGGIHKNQINDDARRQKIIEKNNIKFYRIKSEEVENNIIKVLKDLETFIKNNS